MRTGITESAVSINEPAVAEKESAKRTAAHSDPHRFLHGMKKSLAMCSSLLIALQSQRAVAEPVWAVGVNPSQGGVDSLVQPGMAGWTFSLTTSVKVMGLGWYNQNLDGLSEAHQLGVWQYASATNLEVQQHERIAAVFSGHSGRHERDVERLLQGGGSDQADRSSRRILRDCRFVRLDKCRFGELH